MPDDEAEDKKRIQEANEAAAGSEEMGEVDTALAYEAIANWMRNT